MSTIKNNPPSKGTSIVCSIIGNILLVIGLVLAVVPIAAAIVGYTKDGFIQNEFLLTAICLEFVGIFLMFIGAAVTAFGKFGLLDFSVPKGNEIDYRSTKIRRHQGSRNRNDKDSRTYVCRRWRAHPSIRFRC